MDSEESKHYLRLFIFCVILAVVIASFVFAFFKQQSAFNKEKLKVVIHALESERIRLASDLHDDLGPVMATVRIYVNALSQSTINDKELTRQINDYLDNGIRLIRETANVLMPKALEKTGVLKALEDYIAHIEQYITFRIHFVFPAIALQLDRESELNIYRIVQEIITNTIRHAKATTLQIVFEIDNTQLIIFTNDDGVGFSTKQSDFISNGNGLSNIRSRIAIMNGHFTIHAQAGQGVQFELTIPLTNNRKQMQYD